MMNKLRFLQKIGGPLLMLLLFAACSQEDTQTTGTLLPEGKYPLELTAGVLEVSEKIASRSSTSENIWETGEKVALQVVGDNNVYSYSATGTDGLRAELTSENPYYWKSTDDIAVKAWAYGDNVFRNTPLTEWEVQSNQNDDIHANYQNSDLIYAPAKTAAFNGNNELTFYHQTAKIVVHVYNKEIVEGKDGRNITLAIGTNDNPIALGGKIQEPTDGGNHVSWSTIDDTNGVVVADNKGSLDFSVPSGGVDRSATSFYAMVIPQTVAKGKKLFQFTVPGLENIPFYYTPENDVEWKAGMEYTYCITIKGTTAEVTVGSITAGSWGNGGTYDLTTN